jgi:galactonate dehydratase
MCTPNFLIQEHGHLGQGYLKNPFSDAGGFLSIPEGPGLGIEVDEKAVRAMEWKEWDTPRLFHEDGSVADW